jgi:hypothetical protein
MLLCATSLAIARTQQSETQFSELCGIVLSPLLLASDCSLRKFLQRCWLTEDDRSVTVQVDGGHKRKYFMRVLIENISLHLESGLVSESAQGS